MNFIENLKLIVTSWSVYSVVAMAVLYVAGYLSLRFNLAAMGVVTDLPALAEGYLFSGAYFLVYLATSVPNALLLAAVPVAIVAGVVRLMKTRTTIWKTAFAPALTGVIFSVATIQFVMRQCFCFQNLLLGNRLAGPAWLQAVLLEKIDGAGALFFASLLAAIACSAGLFWIAWRHTSQSNGSRMLEGLLLFLIGLQVLLLPVNYGILISGKTLPAVADLGGKEPLASGETAWLVWEGDKASTFFLRSLANGSDQRRIVTIPREGLQMKIKSYDPILKTLYEPSAAQSAAKPSGS